MSSEQLEIVDRLEILDLYARYNHAIDAGSGDAWRACFAEDGFLSLPYRNVVHRGDAALRRTAEEFPAKTEGRGRHVVTNIALSPSREGVSGLAYLALIRGGWGETPPVIELTGRYHDLLVRESGRWCFASRVLEAD